LDANTLDTRRIAVTIERQIAFIQMNFGEWLSLSDVEREAEKLRWHAFEPGYWHSIAVEATARFAAEFGSTRHVTQVFKACTARAS